MSKIRVVGLDVHADTIAVAVAESLWFWVLPDSARRVVNAIYSFFENSVPAPVVRVLGVLGVLAGFAFIYVGVYVV